MGTTRSFGPFADVPADLIKDAGFLCNHCRRAVERLAQVVPTLAPRMIFYTCKCGSVAVWEDERQPDSRLWWRDIRLLRKAKVSIIIF
jgi:hypothetical protein